MYVLNKEVLDVQTFISSSFDLGKMPASLFLFILPTTHVVPQIVYSVTDLLAGQHTG
jgi:hypothetical protein